MGKNSKAKDAELMRQYRDEQLRKEREQQKKQNRLLLQIGIAVVAMLVLICVVVVAIAMGGKSATGEEDEPQTDNSATAVSMDSLDFSEVDDISKFTATDAESDYVLLRVSYVDKDGEPQSGSIVIRLFPEVAPATVANFKELVASKFYDGLTFHRVIEDFMIQGGNSSVFDPDTITGEFTSNGFTNNLKHVRGVVSMARTSDYNSASGQFFIVQKDSSHLDGLYASFGYVVYGMDAVDGIAGTQTDSNDAPVETATIISASFVNLAE
jgi:cyclophilin family peptidyl-prolyl cis-trans isomerase